MQEERTKKPFYKKWWVWLIAGFLIIGAIGGGEETASLNQAQVPSDSNSELDKPGEDSTGDIEVAKEPAVETEKEEPAVNPVSPATTTPDTSAQQPVLAQVKKEQPVAPVATQLATETKKEEPVQAQVTTQPAAEPKQDCPPGTINVNTASREELMNIIHIDEKRVDDLIKNRPYATLDQLDRINGIAKQRVADIKAEGLACAN
ncbi:hypothetical protein BHU72_11785 [Desulfuribacillus stibiiarsenatis]|uniref:Helix-hairpin-helix DNA-binding motif class 1 domain-containing protein n=1 Tax=Desulfuribacillus stibiiarsenatis TaxID=1390249 RepID=A0A1E5L7U8_9FIRM|nr:helix-hairpin-helix domain-containing protein [Desulfuribacillus stibiiarsenatis]OEH86211.1 hypothetical protein BHU72_11785 [Desulfuribacillus stibiiarsenatis]